MDKQANINEIFSSIQGEGPYIGYRQIFVRFSGCNLSCAYCDTDHSTKKSLSAEELSSEIINLNPPRHHSISLTGGEPLVQTNFLLDFLPKLKNIRVYLETNGTLHAELAKIIDYVDIISMDIKLKSSTGVAIPFNEHKKFIETAKNAAKEIFVKIVINEKITDEEILTVSELVKADIPLILQPMDNVFEQEKLLSVYEKFLDYNVNTRIIPQTHKFMGLR